MNKQINLLALSKATKAIRSEVLPGEYTIDSTFRVVGTMKVGEDFEQSFPQSIKPFALLASALSKLNGVTIEAIVRESLENTIDTEEIELRAKVAISKLVAPTVKVANGKVTHKCVVEEITTQTQAKEILSQQAPMGWHEV